MSELTEQQTVMLKALKASAGNVSIACKKANVGRRTHYDWCAQSAHYKNEVEDIQEGLIDLAETKLMQKINDGDTTSTIFFLKTKGKARGYIERQEQELSGSIGLPLELWTSRK